MEEDLETAELKERIDQRIEEAEERATPTWVKALSLSTAIIAVFAAVASLQSGSNSNEAILEKSEAMLAQAKASDQWAYYQAKTVKAAIATGQATIIDGKPDVQTKLQADAKRYRDEADEIKHDAEKHEERVAEADRESAHFMLVHETFARSVTLLQIAIALSAIAALVRMKAMWYVGLATSGAGLVLFVMGFV
jgi:uncharacterized membrane protein YidH (DUF202 family)